MRLRILHRRHPGSKMSKSSNDREVIIYYLLEMMEINEKKAGLEFIQRDPSCQAGL
jgi:hypothetical protein